MASAAVGDLMGEAGVEAAKLAAEVVEMGDAVLFVAPAALVMASNHFAPSAVLFALNE